MFSIKRLLARWLRMTGPRCCECGTDQGLIVWASHAQGYVCRRCRSDYGYDEFIVSTRDV